MSLDIRLKEDLYTAFENADSIVMKKYLGSLSAKPICNLPELLGKIPTSSNFQISRVAKIVYDKKENVLDKLTTAYNTIASYRNCAIVMLVCGNEAAAELYLGVCCRDINADGVCNSGLRGKQNATLKSAMIGNFPGTEFVDIVMEENAHNKGKCENNQQVMGKLLEQVTAVSSVSGIATLRNEKHLDNAEFVQGLEKLIDSMRGKRYSAVFIADVIASDKIEELCAGYEDLYSALAPFAKSTQTINEGESDTDSVIKGITDTTNESIAKSLSHGTTKGMSKSNTIGGSVRLGPVEASYSHTSGINEGTSDTTSKSTTSGTSKSLTEQNSVAKALTTGEALQLSYENRAVKTLLDRIDEQIKRLRSCEDFGIFDFGAYFLAKDAPTSIAAACMYNSLMRGENSSVEASAINTWENDSAKLVLEYIKRMYHPLLSLEDANNDGAPTAVDNAHLVTPTSLVSGRELSIHIGLPKKSVSGLPVIECAEFGREVISYDQKYSGDIELGSIFHMHKKEEKRVFLNKQSLRAHTFITGSTGSGKSNAIYQLLSKLSAQDINFLVVEPAKGEYRSVFKHRTDVTAYGTNPRLHKMLRINPFKFPREIHVLEHLDRLVEIFNVCWPMYAAMPAILKDAMERAYIAAGWDLQSSKNKCDDRLYPTFADVLEQIRLVLNESEYSEDNKGDYIGALSTRLKSLTNGINGMIFTANDLSNEELFDQNVIVDLSRVGSTETKALLMGLLVMKLQEHRMSSATPNSPLRHITVLEEAHNLLKRTSSEQSADGANLLGKSVEMLANSIAEMRTYGEGFIIADQSPGLLDLSVIRNTNTKIILRLPDFSDRELVGKSAGLNDDQIIELAKLRLGVAAIYQNDWLGPLLCQIDEFKTNPTAEEPHDNTNAYPLGNETLEQSVLELIMNKEVYRKGERVDFQQLRDAAVVSSLSTGIKCAILEYLDPKDASRFEKLQTLVYRFFNSSEVVEAAKTAESIEAWKESVLNHIVPTLQGYEQEQIDLVLGLLLQEQSLRDSSRRGVFDSYVELFLRNGGIL